MEDVVVEAAIAELKRNADELGLVLSEVDLEKEEDELFTLFGIAGDLAKKTQLRKLVRAEKLRGNERKHERLGFGSREIDNATEIILRSIRNGGEGKLPSNASAFNAQFHAARLRINITSAMLDTIKEKISSDGENFLTFCSEANVDFVVTQQEDTVPVALINFLTTIRVDWRPWAGDSEDEIHAYTEEALSEPITWVTKKALQVRRNKKRKTSSGRADYSIYSRSIQLLRGEDKLEELSTSQDPSQELIDKAPSGEAWDAFYGRDVSYIFGYYAIAGREDLQLQFTCISKDGTLTRLTTKSFDLRTVSGVLACRIFMVALIPHLLCLRNSIKVPVGAEWRLVRDGAHRGWQNATMQIQYHDPSKQIVLVKDFFFALNQKAEMQRQLRLWQNTLGKITESPHLMKLVEIKGEEPSEENGLLGRVRCKYTPFCMVDHVVPFEDNLDATAAVLQVAVAVKALHASNLIYNDLRWENVCRNMSHLYVLVDYDLITETGADGMAGGIVGLDSSSHAPNVAGRHGKEVDIWGMGYLLAYCKCKTGNVQELVNHGGRLMGKFPNYEGNELDVIIRMCSDIV